MLADEAFILEKEIRDMSFTLSHLVEQNIVLQLMEQASAPKPKKADIHGNWASLNDVDEIADDIIEMQSAFDENDWNFELNGLFLNKKQVNSIRKGLDYKLKVIQPVPVYLLLIVYILNLNLCKMVMLLVLI